MKEYNVEINSDLFVIPNRSVHGLSGFTFRSEKTENYLKDICEASGYEFNPDDHIIETWMVGQSEGIAENMADHMSHITICSEIYHFSLKSRYLPKAVIDGKEGDIKTIIIPGITATNNNEDTVTLNLHINCKLCQVPYRYGRFGKFETVLDKVCS